MGSKVDGDRKSEGRRVCVAVACPGRVRGVRGRRCACGWMGVRVARECVGVRAACGVGV